MSLARFTNKQEQEYNTYIYKEDLSFIRRMLIFSVILYMAFGVLDVYVVTGPLNVFLFIRFVIVLPIVLIIIAMSYSKHFERIHQYVLTTLFVIASLGIVTMLIVEPTLYSYYGGLFLVFGFGYSLLGINWEFVTVGSVINLITYLILSLIYNPELIIGAIINSVFYAGFVVISLYSSFTNTKYRKDSYTLQLSLKDDNVSLEREIYERLMELDASNRITVYALANLAESRDEFTGEHIHRVGDLSKKLSMALPEELYVKNNLDKEDFIQDIELASTLHDIGKIGISEQILMKPGPLTKEERTAMKEHTILGSSTLEKIKDGYPNNNFINTGISICKYHHENWDGTGYPMGLKGKEIPFAARIVAVIDVYDALISERPYKKAFSEEKSISEMRVLRGTKFDPDIIDIFIDMKK